MTVSLTGPVDPRGLYREPVFGMTGYGGQFQDLAQGKPAIVPVRRTRLLVFALICVGLVIVAVWLGWPELMTWIETGQPRYRLVTGAFAVIGALIGLKLPVQLLLRPRRLVLTRDRFAEQERRHGDWTAVFDVAWEDVQSVAVDEDEFRMIRLPGHATCTLTEAAAARIPDPPGRSIRLSFAYGSPRRLTDLLDAARLGLIG